MRLFAYIIAIFFVLPIVYGIQITDNVDLVPTDSNIIYDLNQTQNFTAFEINSTSVSFNANTTYEITGNESTNITIVDIASVYTLREATAALENITNQTGDIVLNFLYDWYYLVTTGNATTTTTTTTTTSTTTTTAAPGGGSTGNSQNVQVQPGLSGVTGTMTRTLETDLTKRNKIIAVLLLVMLMSSVLVFGWVRVKKRRKKKKREELETSYDF